ncbi:MAG: arylsulfatase [Akkermansiaceae bacterium]|nr:arylsulfatase [Akkermansiaceae bacterium]
MHKILSLALAAFTAVITTDAAHARPASENPNIIFILADDWGLGDVKTYGGDRCKIDTPHMDRLAETGMKFTDAHSSSAVCTPTRYGVLTGRYNWRSRLKQMVLYGFSPPLIEPRRETVASMLKQNGYTTCMLGKWHLGMDMPTTDGKPPTKTGENTDWQGKIKNGPNAIGFDYYYGISASLDMPPYIWIENERFVGECTTEKQFLRKGLAHADFEAVDVLPILTEKAVAYIKQEAQGEKPFFLYMPLASPHTPIVPSKNFRGKSPLGSYGDFVMETDWSVGEVVKAVEEAGIAGNTLIIVTADNGCSNAASRGFKDQSQLKFRMGEAGKKGKDDPNGHYASDIYRGHKADIYEGGHRVPFIARWDGQVKAGSVSDNTVCLVDLFATCADIVGAKVADTAAEDSVSILPVLKGTAKAPTREAVVHHSINGSFAIRKGKWKLAFCPGSGGWTNPRPGKTGDLKKLPVHEWVQLFDMEADPAETNNLSGKHPEIVASLTLLAEKYIANGRSTPGAKQQNNGKGTYLYPGWIRHAKK